MHISSSISERIKDERKRVGLNQTEFGDIGKVSRRTQIAYESGEQTPNLLYLEHLEKAGVDVGYIVTGRRMTESSVQEISHEEMELVKAWRTAGVEARFVALKVLKS